MPGERFAKRLEGMRRSDVAAILKLAEQPDVLSFAGGLPAPESFLIEDFAELEAAVLRDRGRAVLGYGPSAGVSALRETLAARMERFGRPTGADEILVTTGGIAALDLVAKAYLDPGDVVLVGAPSYLAALHVLRSYQAEIVGVPLDDQGMDPDALDATLRELAAAGRAPKLLYLVPTFQNPTGLTLPTGRRRRVLALASEHGLRVVEDSAYEDLRFEGEAPPRLCALDPDNVIHINTLSKIVAPSLRLGWLAARREIVDALVLCKQGQDQCSTTAGQWVAHRFLSEGVAERQIESAVPIYRERRDVCLAALRKGMPEGSVWTRPEGGFYTWITLPPDFAALDTEALLPRAVAEQGVAYVAGNAFYAAPDGHAGPRQLRLAYSYLDLDQVELGLRRLAELFRVTLDEAREGGP